MLPMPSWMVQIASCLAEKQQRETTHWIVFAPWPISPRKPKQPCGISSSLLNCLAWFVLSTCVQLNSNYSFYGVSFFKVVTPADSTHTVAIAAVEAAFKSQAAAIITLTTSGLTAHLMAKYRPRCPIIAVTRNEQVARQCHLWRGILPLHFAGEFPFFHSKIAMLIICFYFYLLESRVPDWLKDVDARVQYGINFGKTRGFIRTGDPIIVITGWKQGSGFTNTFRLLYVDTD